MRSRIDVGNVITPCTLDSQQRCCCCWLYDDDDDHHNGTDGGYNDADGPEAAYTAGAVQIMAIWNP